MKIAGGGAHTCGLLESGKLRCWGLVWAGWPQTVNTLESSGNAGPSIYVDRGVPGQERFSTEAGWIIHFPTGR
jgi:hypothetical protein